MRKSSMITSSQTSQSSQTFITTNVYNITTNVVQSTSNDISSNDNSLNHNHSNHNNRTLSKRRSNKRKFSEVGEGDESKSDPPSKRQRRQSYQSKISIAGKLQEAIKSNDHIKKWRQKNGVDRGGMQIGIMNIVMHVIQFEHTLGIASTWKTCELVNQSSNGSTSTEPARISLMFQSTTNLNNNNDENIWQASKEYSQEAFLHDTLRLGKIYCRINQTSADGIKPIQYDPTAQQKLIDTMTEKKMNPNNASDLTLANLESFITNNSNLHQEIYNVLGYLIINLIQRFKLYGFCIYHGKGAAKISDCCNVQYMNVIDKCENTTNFYTKYSRDKNLAIHKMSDVYWFSKCQRDIIWGMSTASPSNGGFWGKVKYMSQFEGKKQFKDDREKQLLLFWKKWPQMIYEILTYHRSYPNLSDKISWKWS